MTTEIITLTMGALNLLFGLLAYLLKSRLDAVYVELDAERQLREQFRVQFEERVRMLESRRETDIGSVFSAIKNVADDIASFRVAQLKELNQVGTEIRAELARLQLMISSQYVTHERCDKNHK